ncbi:SLC13 family permease [Robbsia sp. KACC 23696]|uniref:CitMHS family transporter n=1 Tax=Robbsia sp. KACC 23696 TaxID=3149231 RepID=UPI00325AF432
MLTLIGILIILTVVGTLLSGKSAPLIGLILGPLIGAIAAGFSLVEIADFYSKGVAKVAPVATMFIFAILFFGILQQAGLFTPLVNGLLRLTRGNVIAVCVGTAALGLAAHLDGAGATTFLLTVPALLPLYKRLRLSPYLMLMLIALGAGLMNMTPWAGPLGRSSAVTGLDATTLWHPLIPLQAIGAVLLLALAALLGWREQRRLAREAVCIDTTAAGDDETPTPSGALLSSMHGATSETAGPRKGATAAPRSAPSLSKGVEDVPRWRFFANAALGLMVFGALVSGLFPSALTFMIGVALALLLNHRTQAAQLECIKQHAPNAMVMASIILSAGAFLGVLDGSGMLRALAQTIVDWLPNAVVPRLHLVLGLVGLPMELLLSTDAYYFALLPIVSEIVAPHGVSAASTVYALGIGNIAGTFISPFSPALWLGLGLAGLDIGRYIRFALPTMWAFSLVLLAVAIGLGVIPI